MEQTWARMIRNLGSLKFHGPGRFRYLSSSNKKWTCMSSPKTIFMKCHPITTNRFLLFTLTQLRFMWKERGNKQDNRHFKWTPKADKHKQRSAYNTDKQRERTGKAKYKSRQDQPKRGRLPVPAECMLHAFSSHMHTRKPVRKSSGFPGCSGGSSQQVPRIPNLIPTASLQT